MFKEQDDDSTGDNVINIILNEYICSLKEFFVIMSDFNSSRHGAP